MDKLKADILKSRDIKPISLKNYLSPIKQLSRRIRGKEFKNVEFLADYDKVMVELDKLKETTKKNYLTAIVVALKAYDDDYKEAIERYSKTLTDVSEKYQDSLKNQEKTETQTKNWMDYAELITVKNKLKRDYQNRGTFETLQKYLMLLTYIHHPLRNDYADMKVMKLADYNKLSSEEQNKFNYLILSPSNMKDFYINQYKNRKRLGCRMIPIENRELKRVIGKWLKVNKSGWFFVRANDISKPQNPNGTTKYLNTIFKPYGKKISSSMIRHIVISHDTKGDKTIKELEEKEKKIENKFLHSGKMNKTYRKID